MNQRSELSPQAPRAARGLSSGPCRFAGLLLFAISSLLPCSQAQEPAPLIVGTKQAAPFSYRTGDGPWQGISVDLWRNVCRELGLSFEFKEVPLEELVTGLQEGRLDASVAALTVTPERDAVIDFTHAYYPSGLGIAVRASEGGGFLSALRGVLSLEFFQAAGTLVLVLLLGGCLLWFLERKKNEQFAGPAARGIGAAFWWSAVTMTTVGYGDKAPVTAGGRLMAVVWMFAGVITISGLTASIAATLTLSRLDTGIDGPQDLPGLRSIGCVEDSTGEAYLRHKRLNYISFPTAKDALVALEGSGDGGIEAVIYDAPILRYLTVNEFQDTLNVLPATFERQDYAIALPLDSDLRRRVNRVLLEELSSDGWSDILYRHLGTTPQ